MDHIIRCHETACEEIYSDETRWPRRPYCTDDLGAGLRIRSLRHARKKSHIQPNPPRWRVWSVFDIDRPGAAHAWDDAGLPHPSWVTVNPKNAHAHAAWGLAGPVFTGDIGRDCKPIRYLAAIESAMSERLGADPGYAGVVTKTPGHERWRTIWGPKTFYTLAELAEYLPDIEKHVPRTRADRVVGAGRNYLLFETLRRWAYTAVRAYRDASGLAAWTEWAASVHMRALAMNVDLLGMRALPEREVWHTSKSVAKWVWREGRAAVAKSAARWSALQAHRGRLGGLASGEARAAASEGRRAEALEMRGSGASVRAIAAALNVPRSTVSDWLTKGG